MRLLEGTLGGERYSGPRHFDAHAYRTEDSDGVWDFAAGCMRTYKLLAARAEAFDADPEVRAIIEDQADSAIDPLLSNFTPAKAAQLRALDLDVDALGERALRYERLDQLMVEHLMGARE